MRLCFLFICYLNYPYLLVGVTPSSVGVTPSSFDVCENLPLMDVQTRDFLKVLNAQPSPAFTEDHLKFLQNLPISSVKNKLPQIEKIENLSIPIATGPLNARFYFPEDHHQKLPVFVFFHGGGWALGHVEDYDQLCQKICYQTPCLVISIDYHLAPHYKFPRALEECYAATQWISENIQQFGGHPQQLAVGGDSAGGNLAAAVTLMARDKKSPSIHYQVLIYPVLNHQFDTLSYFLFENNYFLTKESMQFFWKTYLPQKTDGAHPYASPLQASTLSHLPPALMILPNFDPLRDEGLAYAWRLSQDQVPVTVKRYPTIHGFIGYDDFPTSHQAIQEITQHLHQFFNPVIKN